MSVYSQSQQSKLLILKALIDREGGYVNNAKDSGGPTRWGITERLARAYGYEGRMSELPYERALDIYDKEYWSKIDGDNLALMNYKLCEQVLDFAVKTNVTRAVSTLQKCLNILNYHAKYYDDIVEDGLIGAATLKAVNRYLKVREPEVLLRAFNILKGHYLLMLAERRKKDEEFIYGWLKNRINL